MSYCHLSGLPGCSSSPVFHPTTVALLAPKIAAQAGTCLISTLYWDDFEGGIGGWDAKTP
jgi:hypothetical protein